MRGGSMLGRRGMLIVFVVVVLIGSLPGGSLTHGQAQTLGLGPKSHFMAPPVPPEDESSAASSRASSADAAAEPSTEDGLANVQVSRNQSPTDCVRSGAGETSIAGNDDGL